jgi:UDP-N-acetylmuramate: L-alanyl-gamma-D-glutamyl-meso-diaminopimelate ligase
MAALAGLLLERKYRVTGSDSGCYPPMSDLLSALGIRVMRGYRPENLVRDGKVPDMVIIGNVISADNPEARHVLWSGMPFISFPAALSAMFLDERRPLVVAGTHGKTTTSSMLVAGLEGCGFDPGFMIGGIVRSRDTGFSAGSPPWFVLEGDEYDTAFFDKGPKFLHYCPEGLILTSMEFDHADIFRDFQAVREAFASLVKIMPANGIVAACSDWDSVRDVCRDAPCRVVWYGTSGYEGGWVVKDLEVSGEGTSFTACCPARGNFPVRIAQPGLHNALDALGVVALADALGLDVSRVAGGLGRGMGVRRRQETRGVVSGVTVIDDFAHHPRAVMETLSALRAACGKRRLIALFEPRTNTSRRAVFQKRYAESFGDADMVLVREVPDPDKAPEDDRFSSGALVDDLNMRGVRAMLFQDGLEMAEYLAASVCRPGDVVVTLSNGAFDGIHELLLDRLRGLRTA